MPPLQLVNFIVNRVKVIQEAFKLKVSMKTSKRTKYAKSILHSIHLNALVTSCYCVGSMVLRHYVVKFSVIQ